MSLSFLSCLKGAHPLRCSDHSFRFRTKSRIVVHYTIIVVHYTIPYFRNVIILLKCNSFIVSHLLYFRGSGFDYTTSRPVFFFFSSQIKYQYIKTVHDLLYKSLVTRNALFAEPVRNNSSERNSS
jgi:hypothetical protein